MRLPSANIVVDAAILVAAARGRSAGAVIEVANARNLITTKRVVEEARRRIELGLKRPDLLPIVDALVADMTVATAESVAPQLPHGEITLQEAVASRNGSTRDAHVLALAWIVDGDVWSTDRDFAGTGVASWSTPNLLRALAESEAA